MNISIRLIVRCNFFFSNNSDGKLGGKIGPCEKIFHDILFNLSLILMRRQVSMISMLLLIRARLILSTLWTVKKLILWYHQLFFIVNLRHWFTSGDASCVKQFKTFECFFLEMTPYESKYLLTPTCVDIIHVEVYRLQPTRFK